jgi:hypothetical protein
VALPPHLRRGAGVARRQARFFNVNMPGRPRRMTTTESGSASKSSPQPAAVPGPPGKGDGGEQRQRRAQPGDAGVRVLGDDRVGGLGGPLGLSSWACKSLSDRNGIPPATAWMSASPSRSPNGWAPNPPAPAVTSDAQTPDAPRHPGQHRWRDGPDADAGALHRPAEALRAGPRDWPGPAAQARARLAGLAAAGLVPGLTGRHRQAE